MSTFTSTENKAFIRSEWSKSILHFLHGELGYKLVYMGLPSPDAEDVIEWLEYLDKVIAFQCRDYPHPSESDQARDIVDQLEAKLNELKRKKMLSQFAVYDGYLEEVVLNGVDNSQVPLVQQETIMVYNLDFCNQITSPLDYINEQGEAKQAYKFQVIKNLLMMQQSINDNVQKFVMFLTIHAGYRGQEMEKFINDPDGDVVRSIIDRYKGMKGIPRKSRILRIFVVETLRSYFQSFGYTPHFLPTVLYKGTGGFQLLHFSVMGTKSEAGITGGASWNQSLKDICKLKLIGIEEGNFQRIEEEGLEETDGAINPIDSFSRSKTYKEQWTN